MRAIAFLLILCLLGVTAPGCGQGGNGGPKVQNTDSTPKDVKTKGAAKTGTDDKGSKAQ